MKIKINPKIFFFKKPQVKTMSVTNNRFRLEVWNALEKLWKNYSDYFTGTKKGMIREIEEYAHQIETEYLNQSRITDIIQFIERTIKRDMRK